MNPLAAALSWVLGLSDDWRIAAVGLEASGRFLPVTVNGGAL